MSELTEAAEMLPLLAPEAEPPPGFERRAVAAMTGLRRWRWLRTAAVAVAAAAVAAIVSVVTVRLVDNGRSERAVSSVPSVSTATMVTTDGRTAGHVAVASSNHTAAMVISVEYAVADGRYEIELRSDAGTTTLLGAVTIDDGRGTWTGRAGIPSGGAWIVLVDNADREVCTARLDGSKAPARASPAS